MKKSRLLVVFSLIMCAVTLFSGCGSREFSSAKVESVGGLIGGGTKLEYNKDLKEIYVGGEGEKLAYFEQDIASGIERPGYYVGLMFTAPQEVDEFETGVLSFQGKTISAGRFYKMVNGQKTREFVVYPEFTEEKREVDIKITWQDGSKEQSYKVIVLPQTQFEM